MRFLQQREAALGYAFNVVQTLDHRVFPQRFVHIEWTGVNARGEDTQLPPVAGLWQGNVAHMILEIEILVLDPIGMIEVQGNTHQLLSKGPRAIQTPFHIFQDVLEAHGATECRRRVINPQPANVHRRR